jgi:hypothetical protein
VTSRIEERVADEFAVDDQRAGVDYHVLGRAILAAHLHVLVAQRLAGPDACEQGVSPARLHDEVGDRPPMYSAGS